VREQIIAEIRRLAAGNGGQPLGVRAFERETGITEGSWRGLYWARWSDALKEAGFEPNEFEGRSDPEHILKAFIEVARHYNRLPAIMEVRMYRRTHPELPNEKTIHSYFGSKQKLLEAVREWTEGKQEYADIVAMLGEVVERPSSAPSKEGLVYLIKSGPHYKIGRSDELERRVKEIRIALPEAASLVHSIRTDDPGGIEAYWHRRFANRRANGEWFKLTNADVAAFKRRRYQ
jgi:hypothetical protein